MGRRFDHYIVLTRSNPRQVLLLPSENGWTTPEWVPETSGWVQQAALKINKVAQAQLGLRATILEALPGDQWQSNGRLIKAYFMEGHDPAWSPPVGSQWVGAEELETTRLAQPELKSLLQNW